MNKPTIVNFEGDLHFTFDPTGLFVMDAEIEINASGDLIAMSDHNNFCTEEEFIKKKVGNITIYGNVKQ